MTGGVSAAAGRQHPAVAGASALAGEIPALVAEHRRIVGQDDAVEMDGSGVRDVPACYRLQQ